MHAHTFNNLCMPHGMAGGCILRHEYQCMYACFRGQIKFETERGTHCHDMHVECPGFMHARKKLAAETDS